MIQNNIFIDAFSALGANPIPMSWGEVFPALETGAIDGQENPILTIADAQLADVQDYVSRTNHVYSALMFLYSKTLFDQLSAEEQAEEGAAAVIAERDSDTGAAIARSLAEAGARSLFIETDVADPASVEAMASEAASVLGPIDILVANAGINVFHEPLETSEAEWRRCFSVDLDGVWHSARAVLPGMRTDCRRPAAPPRPPAKPCAQPATPISSSSASLPLRLTSLSNPGPVSGFQQSNRRTQ